MAAKHISRTAIGPSSASLQHIHEADCNLAIWQRDLEFAVADWPKEIRLTVKMGQLHQDLSNALISSDSPASPMLGALLEDVVHLAEKFARIAKVDRLNLRLAVVESDSCRKFHADWVTMRLITTYAGIGTQWLDDEDAKRVSREEEATNIYTLATGDVGIFKGRLATDRPAIHRSPPIAGTGVRRLLLVLDPVDAGADESSDD